MARITTAQFAALTARVEAAEATIAGLPVTIGQAVATALSTTLGSYSTPTLVAEGTVLPTAAEVVEVNAQAVKAASVPAPKVTKGVVNYVKHDGTPGQCTPAAFEARQRIATAAGKPLTITGSSTIEVPARPTTTAGRKAATPAKVTGERTCAHKGCDRVLISNTLCRKHRKAA